MRNSILDKKNTECKAPDVRSENSKRPRKRDSLVQGVGMWTLLGPGVESQVCLMLTSYMTLTSSYTSLCFLHKTEKIISV
jgi:hypothetical protein